jgi:hypothetical protein
VKEMVRLMLMHLIKISLEKPEEDMAIEWGNIVSVDFNVRLSRREI